MRTVSSVRDPQRPSRSEAVSPREARCRAAWQRCLRPVAVLLVVVAASGCASQRPKVLSVSLTELGTESRIDAGSWWGELRHRQAYNIAGTGAIDSIGMLSSDPDPSPLLDVWRSWFRKELLPDQLALRLAPGCSRVYLRDFDGRQPISAEDVISVRDGLQLVQNRVVDLVAAQTGQQLLGALAETQEEIARLKSPAAGGSVNEQQLTVLEKRRDALTAWLSTSGYGPIGDTRDLEPLIKAGQKRIDELTRERRAAEAEFAKARGKPGIVVARWKIDDRRQRQVGIVGASHDATSQEDGSGFVVLGAPRVATLAAGDDMVIRACQIEKANCKGANGPSNGGNGEAARPNGTRDGIDSVVPPKRLYVTTYQLLARHAAWTDARSLRRIQSLAVSLNKLIDTLTPMASAKTLDAIKMLQLTLVQTSSTAVDAENMGALSVSGFSTLGFSFADDKLLDESVQRVIERNKDYLVISSMRSTLDGHILRQSGAGTTWPKEATCTSLGAEKMAAGS